MRDNGYVDVAAAIRDPARWRRNPHDPNTAEKKEIESVRAAYRADREDIGDRR